MQATYLNPAYPWADLFLAPALVVLAPGERWCARCGESLVHEDACPRCAATDCVDPRRILRPTEYVVTPRDSLSGSWLPVRKPPEA